MKKLNIFILLCLSVQVLQAQQSDLSGMYPLNYYLINSAAVGSDTTWQVFTGYRKQWSGISNSPSLGYLGVSGRVGRNQGAGLFVEQSKYGLLSDFNAKLSYAYHVKLSPGNSLHAGASVGFMSRNFQMSKVIASDYSDNLLAQNSPTGSSIQSDIGVMFTSRRLLLGVSLPQIISANGAESKTGFNGYYILHGSYDVISNETWLFQAIAARRKSKDSESQTDVGARLLWKNQFGGGVGYRTVSGLFLRVEIKLRDLLSVGYVYENGTSSTGKSHEVMVAVRFGRKKKNRVAEVEAIPKPGAESRVQKTTSVAIDTVAKKAVVIEPRVAEPAVVAAKATEEKKVINRDSLNEIFGGERLIFFKLRSSDKILSENYETSLDLVEQILKENPELKITIVGHTCRLGREEVNRKISENRARQVFDSLERRGISPQRMDYTGMGETEPIDQGDSGEQLARNRRVQIRFGPATE